MKHILVALSFTAAMMLAACNGAEDENKAAGEVVTAPAKPLSMPEQIEALEAKLSPEKPLDPSEAMHLAALYQQYADSLPKDPKSPVYLMKASDQYASQGMRRQQCSMYKTVFEKFPDFKDADMAMYLYASSLDSDFDQRAEAKKYYELYIKTYPKSIYVGDAKARLETIDELSFKQLQDKIIENQLKTPQ